MLPALEAAARRLAWLELPHPSRLPDPGTHGRLTGAARTLESLLQRVHQASIAPLARRSDDDVAPLPSCTQLNADAYQSSTSSSNTSPASITSKFCAVKASFSLMRQAAPWRET